MWRLNLLPLWHFKDCWTFPFSLIQFACLLSAVEMIVPFALWLRNIAVDWEWGPLRNSKPMFRREEALSYTLVVIHFLLDGFAHASWCIIAFKTRRSESSKSESKSSQHVTFGKDTSGSYWYAACLKSLETCAQKVQACSHRLNWIDVAR